MFVMLKEEIENQIGTITSDEEDQIKKAIKTC